MRISFTIHGEPRGKGRPRFSRSGRVFTDAKTAAYERAIKATAQSVMAGRSALDGAVWVRIEAYLAAPSSISKKKRAAMLSGETRPTKRPDLDNIVKAILDGINGVVFNDDSQVVGTGSQKFWTDKPRVEVTVGLVGE